MGLAQRQETQPVASSRADQLVPIGLSQGRETQPVASSSARGRKRKEIPEPTVGEEGLEDYRRKVRVLATDGGPAE